MEKNVTTLYGLVGRRLGHSFSRGFFHEKFSAMHLPADYINIEIPEIGELTDVVARTPNLAGFNVTVPYKEAIIPLLDAIEGDAREIGAVNTVKVERNDHDGAIRLRGFNTDCEGFRSTLPRQAAEWTAALVLGTGGAAKAVCHALRTMGIEPLTVSRRQGCGDLTYGDLTEAIVGKAQLIVNATPAGMWPDVGECPPFPLWLIDSRHFCYDLIYNPAETEFMRRACTRGASVKNGLDMLYAQANASWLLWN